MFDEERGVFHWDKVTALEYGTVVSSTARGDADKVRAMLARLIEGHLGRPVPTDDIDIHGTVLPDRPRFTAWTACHPRCDRPKE